MQLIRYGSRLVRQRTNGDGEVKEQFIQEGESRLKRKYTHGVGAEDALVLGLRGGVNRSLAELEGGSSPCHIKTGCGHILDLQHGRERSEPWMTEHDSISNFDNAASKLSFDKIAPSCVQIACLVYTMYLL